MTTPRLGARLGLTALVVLLTLLAGLAGTTMTTRAEGPNAVMNLPGCATNAVARGDDGSSAQTPLGFPINFFGATYSNLYANINGNVTFTSSLSTFTPTPIQQGANMVIIAPFWADVDTRGSGSGTVTYGPTTANGRPAFCVNWLNVGYYSQKVDKLNSFQLVLIDRGDTGANNFDIYMNYDKIQWETGDASQGSGGLGGKSARMGYSNGTNSSFELPGSAVNGAFLDSNPTTALIKNARNSNQLGRYIFEVRNGAVQPPASPSPNPSASPTAPVCLTPGAIDFGNQIVGSAAPSQLAVLNNCGTQPLAISLGALGGANPGDFAIVSSCAGTTIAVGASCGVRATFTPVAAGPRGATVALTYPGGAAELRLGGTGELPHPPFNLTILTSGQCTVGVTVPGGAADPGPYAVITRVTLTPNPAPGWMFIYWKSERGFMGWAEPWSFDMNADHIVTAYCVPQPSFSDYTPTGPARQDPIIRLAALEIIRGYQADTCRERGLAAPCFGPNDQVLRAQMAALIARGMGRDRLQTWDQEDHNNTFPDRGFIDDNLWRNIGTLYYYNVARGYQDGTYQPTGFVLYAQTISFITRAMVFNGYWVQQSDNGPYPNVPPDSGHRTDIATYVSQAGTNAPVPGTATKTENWPLWNQNATRLWFSQAEWQALNSYFGVGNRFAP